MSWDSVPAWVAGNPYQTPSMQSIVQEIVDRGDWSDVSDMVLIVIGGGGSRVAESRNGSGDEPLLHIEYDSGGGCGAASVEEKIIDNNNRDSEENATTGNIDSGSSDLELVHEDGTAQLIGLRFTNIAVTKVDSIDPVPVNTNYNYEIEVTNFGPETATDVTLTDVLPAALSFVSVFTDQSACSESSSTVSCAIGTIGIGNTVVVTIFVTAPGTAQTVTNTVSIDASSVDTQTLDNSAA